MAIVTLDFKLSYQIQEGIRGYYSFQHYSPLDDYSLAKVVLTSRKERNIINHENARVIYKDSLPSKIRSIIIHSLKESEINECVVGVDPGKTIGAAIIYRGTFLISGIFFSERELIYWIDQQLQSIPAKKIIIKVGNGIKSCSDDLHKSLNSAFKNTAEVVLIDEKNTSLKSRRNISIHEEAAIRIAMRD